MGGVGILLGLFAVSTAALLYEPKDSACRAETAGIITGPESVVGKPFPYGMLTEFPPAGSCF